MDRFSGSLVLSIGFIVGVVLTGCSSTTASEAPVEPIVAPASSVPTAPSTTTTITEPPVTEQVVTEPPVTEPVVTEPAVTTPPMTEPPVETAPPPEVSVLDRPLEAVGESNGVETARVQLRLIEIGFWVSHFDGRYGFTTRQGVMAFQKYAGLKPTGSVDDQTAMALTIVSSRPIGRTTDPGVVVEIDKDRQLLFMIVDGRLEWALNISTGSGQYYLEPNQKDPTRWESGRSLTPSGHFRVQRERPEGWWQGDLGEIYRPKYFNGGIAIHGSSSIPNYPASHGCVRVSTPAMDMIWASGLVPIGTPVWVYGEDVPPFGDPPQPLPPATEPPLATTPPLKFGF